MLAGCIAGIRGGGAARRVSVFALASFIAYVAINAGYYMWWGGWAMGPRLMLPMFAALPLGLAFCGGEGSPRWLWPLAIGLGVASVLLNMPLAILDPQVPQGNEDLVLAAANFSTRLRVPQFVYLRAFYTLSGFRYQDGGLAWGALLQATAAVAAPVGCLVLAARMAATAKEVDSSPA